MELLRSYTYPIGPGSTAVRVLLPLVCLTLLLGALPGRGARAETPGMAEAPAIDPRLERALGGFVDPLFVTHAGDGSGRLFIVERAGRMLVTVDGEVLPDPLLDLTPWVTIADQHQGMQGLAFHPDYATNGLLFVSYTARDGTNTLMRFTVSAADPNRVDPASGEVILELPDRLPDHNLGMLAFGPDGYLFVATGDEGGYGDPFNNAQSLKSLYGKILRLDIDAPGVPYAIPPDNPFAERDDARGEV